MLKKNVLAVSFCTLLLVSLFQFLFVFEVQWTGRDLVCKAPSTNCQHSVNDLLLTSVRKAELATKSTCKKDTYRPSGKEKGAWLLFFFFSATDHNVLLLKEKENIINKICPSVSIFLLLMPFEIKCVEGTKARCTVLTDNCKGGYFLLKQFF